MHLDCDTLIICAADHHVPYRCRVTYRQQQFRNCESRAADEKLHGLWTGLIFGCSSLTERRKGSRGDRFDARAHRLISTWRDEDGEVDATKCTTPQLFYAQILDRLPERSILSEAVSSTLSHLFVRDPACCYELAVGVNNCGLAMDAVTFLQLGAGFLKVNLAQRPTCTVNSTSQGRAREGGNAGRRTILHELLLKDPVQLKHKLE